VIRSISVEIEKARNLVNNFEKLPARDIKNIVQYLMSAINMRLIHVSQEFEDFDRDFLVAYENQILSKDMGEMYFYLKGLYSKEFKKSDRDMVIVKGWKNNFYIKKTYFKNIIDSVEHLIELMD